MNKSLTKLLLILSMMTGSTMISANTSTENNICSSDAETVVAFFNGVLNTDDDVDISLRELKQQLGQTVSDGTVLRYEKMYNHTNGLEDFVETFEQRLREQEELAGRYELFFQAITGQGTFLTRLSTRIAEVATNMNQFSQVVQARVIRNLTTLLADPPTMSNYQEHRTRIDNWGLEGKKLLFIAHSQGNLFVNNAYNYALNTLTAENVKVVHVAPASPLLSGPHVLANQDLVINGLRAVGSVASNTHSIPVYIPFGNNHGRDLMGHGFTETYMNAAFPMLNDIKKHIHTALDTLVAPPAEASSGFFTVTLTWDGSGDVDLHTFEPSGSHVFYRNLSGETGYLDVDNVTGYGPEHYFATCDKTKLQTGTYSIRLANYARAEGRQATVQIASDRQGVLDTKVVTMGAATGDDPVFQLFNVVVKQDPETLRYSVSLN